MAVKIKRCPDFGSHLTHRCAFAKKVVILIAEMIHLRSIYYKAFTTAKLESGPRAPDDCTGTTLKVY